MNVITILCDTIRRDHCGPWHRNRPLSSLGDTTQPDWIVPTPNMDRLAARGTVFDNAWCGSHPCMPARRDMYTGNLEFLSRGWGPLEDTDADLPTVISGPPNTALSTSTRPVSQLVTDHFHLWERGAGNYHMGYSGFAFIRGMEADAWKTDPVTIDERWQRYMGTKVERHFHNLAAMRDTGIDGEPRTFAERTFGAAATWLDRNSTHDSFYLHIDSFSPHEPWDPPEDLVRQFDPRGYDVPNVLASAPYARTDISGLSPDDIRHVQALYAASVVHVDQCLGMVFDALDRHDLWENTMVVFTTDHGTFNGSHHRTGKLQTHLFTPISSIPMIIAHPTLGQGERRDQLVQLVDLYPTTIAALSQTPTGTCHGVNLLPVLASDSAPTRDVAINGVFGESISITDGDWMLHMPPVGANTPLFWYSHHQARFLPYDLGPFECQTNGTGRRAVQSTPFDIADGPWLSDLRVDHAEQTNRYDMQPDHVARLQAAFVDELMRLGGPPDHIQRLGLTPID